jgi:sugar transferase (PEP-CTERM system associated)
VEQFPPQPGAGNLQGHLFMTAGMALFILDALIVALAWPATMWLALRGGDQNPAWLQGALFAVFDLLFLYALGFYRRDSLSDTFRASGRAPLSVAIGAIAASLISVVFGLPLSARFAIAAMLCFTGSAMVARMVFLMLRRNALFRPRLLVIGAGQRAWDLLWILRSQGRHLQYDVTFVHEDTFGAIDPRLADDLANHIITSSGNLLDVANRVFAEQIVVAPDERRGMALESLITCRTAGYPVYQYMTFLEKEAGRIDIKRLDVDWVLYSEGFTIGPLGRGIKRIVDIAVSLLILVCTLPLLLPAMVAVWLGDRGPIFYRQERVTQGGRKFRIFKLRTMRTDAEKGGAVWAAAADSRITPTGKFLRRSRIDELPQLINVLKGDMSLVGPRPERPEFIEDLAVQLPLYRERHAVRSGLTGWAQINYPYGASLDDARSKLSYDLYYVKKFSFFLDMLIIMQTLRVVIWPGAGVR